MRKQNLRSHEVYAETKSTRARPQQLQIATINFHGEAVCDVVQRQNNTKAVLQSRHNPFHPSKNAR